MNEVFGISMASIMTVLLALLALCLLAVAWVFLRRPVIFKMGLRNIPRRKAQSILIVIGLMLSTLIMSAALGVGDTVDNSITSEVYDILGPVDEVVVFSQDVEANATNALNANVPGDALARVDQALQGDPNVDGVLPFLLETVPVQNEGRGLSEPAVTLAGTDPERLGQVGELRDLNGDAIAFDALAADELVISEKTADELGAQVGDTLRIFYNNAPTDLRVAAVAPDSILAGQLSSDSLGAVMPLQRLQDITGQSDTLSMIAVSNAGDDRAGVDVTDAVVAKLEGALAGQNLGVNAIKQDGLDQASLFSSIFTGFFLVLGLFSIAAGILLIVLIFTMLAAERRPEMGMTRAIGGHRRQLIQQFVSEGSGYALLSGLVGAALGVGATYAIGFAMRALFGDFLPIEPLVTLRSLIVAYCLGVVITFLAVVASSWRISRLNVVAAVRDIPDVSTSKRRKRTLVWAALLALIGVGLTLAGFDSDRAAFLYPGLTILPFGVALVLLYFGARSGLVMSAVGIFILALWLLPPSAEEALFGELQGDFEMFFLSGICMVLGATILIVNNLDFLLAALSRIGAIFRGSLPAVRTAIAYPSAARGRTGMTIAMFSLIVFSLVMMATMSRNFNVAFSSDTADAGWDIRADTGNANPITDFQGTLRDQGVDTDGFRAVGTLVDPLGAPGQLRMPGTDEWKALLILGMDDAFLAGSELPFQQRAEGYADDAAIIEALRTQPNVAVVDSAALESSDPGQDENQFRIAGLTADQDTFAPVQVEINDPDGQPVPVTVIGVIDSKVSIFFGSLFASQPNTVAQIFPGTVVTSYFVALDDPERADVVAKEVEAALLANGVQATSLQEFIEDQSALFNGFLYLIQGFMGLGLIVGVAAVGVIAFRSVVERRQQIGILRAIGYQRSLVSLSFLIETAFMVGLGVISGTILGVSLARLLFLSDDIGIEGASFVVPWAIITVILLATIVAALLMAWIPSRQAARIAPAEALRYE